MAPSSPAVRHPRWTLTVVCVATFMLLLDLTIVAVALSDIQADFHADLGSLQWVVDAYTLPLAGLLLTAATLGDRIGRRRMYLLGMAIFTAGSAACALAWTPLVLDLTRALQGVGAALLFGVSLPLIAAAFPSPKARAGAIGVYGATLAGATAVGPLVGGALVDGPGWRWIFLINLPIGVAALVAGRYRLTESNPPVARTADWPGTALLTGGLLALLLALIRGNTDGWTSARILGLFGLAVLLLGGFFVREVVAREPMLDLTLFRRMSFTGVAVSGFTLNATLVAATSFLGLYVVNTLGYGPFQAGLRFLPLTVASFVAAPIVARLVDTVPPRFTVGGGVLLAAIGLGLCAHLDGHSSWVALLPGFIVAGLGLGAASASMSQAALAAVEESRAGMASGTVFTMRQTGLAAGVAILGALFKHRASGDMGDRLVHVPTLGFPAAPLTNAVGDGAGARVADGAPAAVHEALAEAARAATATAIDEILLVGAVAGGLAAVFALIVVRRFPALPRLATPVGGAGGARGVARLPSALVLAPPVVTPVPAPPPTVLPSPAAASPPTVTRPPTVTPVPAPAVAFSTAAPIPTSTGVALPGTALPGAAFSGAALPGAALPGAAPAAAPVPAPAVTTATHAGAAPAAEPPAPALLAAIASWPPAVAISTPSWPPAPAAPASAIRPATAPPTDAPAAEPTPPPAGPATPPATVGTPTATPAASADAPNATPAASANTPTTTPSATPVASAGTPPERPTAAPEAPPPSRPGPATAKPSAPAAVVSRVPHQRIRGVARVPVAQARPVDVEPPKR